MYEQTYSFMNDFPALLENVPNASKSEDELFQMETAKGNCKVMCFHPNSNVTVAIMKVSEIKEVIQQ
jgi:UDPglucose--hexose-1-phosphate uridylyltransferase